MSWWQVIQQVILFIIEVQKSQDSTNYWLPFQEYLVSLQEKNRVNLLRGEKKGRYKALYLIFTRYKLVIIFLKNQYDTMWTLRLGYFSDYNGALDSVDDYYIYTKYLKVYFWNLYKESNDKRTRAELCNWEALSMEFIGVYRLEASFYLFLLWEWNFILF